MGIGGQITVLLKLEYPSIIKESSGKTYYAKNWAHYNIIEDDDGMTAADRFKEEFWSIYSVDDELRSHAEYVLERFAAKQCKNMMYELRVDTVKTFYDKILDQTIKDEVACKKLLSKTQYLKVQPDWISDEAWRRICAYWCSPEYLKKRLRAQQSRMQPDFAQNRGGSRSHGQTKQFLDNKYGPEAATDINTYCCMKAGVKNCDSNGKSGPISTEKAQRRVDDYFATLEVECPNDYEQRKSDGKLDADVMYKSSGRGLAHGRVPIANGAIRKCDMKASAVRSNTTSQSNSPSYQYLVSRNAQLEKGYQIGVVLSKHMTDVLTKLNMPVPEEIAAILQEENASVPTCDQGTESSHAGNGSAGNGAGNGTPGSGNGAANGTPGSGQSNDMEDNEDNNLE